MKTINVQQLHEMREKKQNHQLIDVRQEDEYLYGNINGALIPMAVLLQSPQVIKRDIPVILMCRSGVRSAMVVKKLEKNGFDNLYNLEGGILAWIQHIDPRVRAY